MTVAAPLWRIKTILWRKRTRFGSNQLLTLYLRAASAWLAQEAEDAISQQHKQTTKELHTGRWSPTTPGLQAPDAPIPRHPRVRGHRAQGRGHHSLQLGGGLLKCSLWLESGSRELLITPLHWNKI